MGTFDATASPQKPLTVFSCLLFPQKAPSWMVDTVLSTLLLWVFELLVFRMARRKLLGKDWD